MIIGVRSPTNIVMTVKQDTLWDRFLSPLIQGLLDKEQMIQLRDRIDWERAVRLADSQVCEDGQTLQFVYPEYYHTQNFHGIEGGYLTQTAAITYDPICITALRAVDSSAVNYGDSL
jgi:hypothetical protein